MNIKKIITLLLLSLTLQASSTIEKSGDVLRILIPALTYGYTYYLDDEVGRDEFHKSFATNLAATYALKYTVQKQRPNGKNNRSFPSGHTSVTMQSATFLHKRYGLTSALAAYAGSIFTGYSRVDSDNHDSVDVLAGAVVGALSSYYFTTSYKGFTISPNINSHVFGINFEKKLGTCR